MYILKTTALTRQEKKIVNYKRIIDNHDYDVSDKV